MWKWGGNQIAKVWGGGAFWKGGIDRSNKIDTLSRNNFSYRVQ